MPKNQAGNIVIFDREIKGWSLGDRKLKPATPAIVIYGQSVNKKDIANYYISLSYIEYLSEPEGEFFKKISILAKKNEIEINTNDFYIITDNSEKEYYNSLLNLYKTSKVCEG